MERYIRYIKKSAVVAEIEKRINKEIQSCATDNCFGYSQGCVDSMRNILSFLNTLEVKEFDIEDTVHGTVDYPLIGCDFPNIYPNYKELKEYCDRKGIKDDDKVKLIIIKDM